MTAVCAFCGQNQVDVTELNAREMMAEHVIVCEKHPLRKAVQACNALRDSLLTAIELFECDEECNTPGTDAFTWLLVAKELTKGV